MVKMLGGRFDLRGLPSITRSYYSIRSLALRELCSQPSEVPHSPGLIQQIVLCRVSGCVAGVHKNRIIPLGRIMAPPEVGPPDRALLVLLVLPTAFFIFEPVLVLLAVGHVGALQRLRVSQLLVGDFSF
jgi:hypothetical protein